MCSQRPKTKDKRQRGDTKSIFIRASRSSNDIAYVPERALYVLGGRLGIRHQVVRTLPKIHMPHASQEEARDSVLRGALKCSMDNDCSVLPTGTGYSTFVYPLEHATPCYLSITRDTLSIGAQERRDEDPVQHILLFVIVPDLWMLLTSSAIKAIRDPSLSAIFLSFSRRAELGGKDYSKYGKVWRTDVEMKSGQWNGARIWLKDWISAYQSGLLIY